VWAGAKTATQLPDFQFLEIVREPILDMPLPFRLFWQTRIFPKLAKNKCDILFTPGGVCVVKDIPFVTMSQNLLPFQLSEMRRFGFSWNFVRLFLLREAQKRSFSNADGIIFLTKFAQSTVIKELDHIKGQTVIIPHGINPSFIMPPREQQPIEKFTNEKPFRILYVSIVNFYKHQWNVATAVARLRQAGLPVVLDLVGPAYLPALNKLKSLLKRIDPKEEIIRYHGPVPYGDLPNWYKMTDSFVFASSCENLPIILLEAMASGLPIASSDRGPMSEILGDSGVYFNPESSDNIEKALSTIIIDYKLRDFCARSAFSIAQNFSWERCASDTFSFINQVASR
jgi:glycosyltransferase involved in cell wall biosynthesis